MQHEKVKHSGYLRKRRKNSKAEEGGGKKGSHTPEDDVTHARGLGDGETIIRNVGSLEDGGRRSAERGEDFDNDKACRVECGAGDTQVASTENGQRVGCFVIPDRKTAKG